MTVEKVGEFKVGQIIYDVVLDPKIMGTEQALGLCDYVNATIHIYPNQNEQRMEQVIFHELLHAIFGEAGYDEQDEDMINRVGIVFNQFLYDNFEFIGHEGIRKQIEASKQAQAEEQAAHYAAEMKLHKHPVGFKLDPPRQDEVTEEVEDFDDEVPNIDGKGGGQS